jgi:hypothetical protein
MVNEILTPEIDGQGNLKAAGDASHTMGHGTRQFRVNSG